MGHKEDVKLYPEQEEPINILNIKRGIISALLVPLSEEEEEQEEQRSSTMVSPVNSYTFELGHNRSFSDLLELQ